MIDLSRREWAMTALGDAALDRGTTQNFLLLHMADIDNMLEIAK